MSSVIYSAAPPYNMSTEPFKYVVYTTGGAFYARNGLTGAYDNTTTADFSTVLNFAITNA